MKSKCISLLAILVAAAALPSCATFEQLEDGLKGLVGQNVSVAVEKLGFPSSERTIAGLRLIDWSNSSTMMLPTTSQTNGTIQNGAKTATYTGTTVSSEPVTFSCKITMRVDEANIIKGYEYEGNLGGCERYINILKRRKS